MSEDESEEFGEESSQNQQGLQGPIRVRLPRDKEVLGILDQRLGASRVMIRCFDGKSRNCRVPGRLKKRLWLREGDVVLVEPWEFDNEKGDVVFKYTPTAVEWLKKKGYLKEISEF
ncbi:MAG: translation initiation factor eIF-1A [Nanoarchaeota archaeon]|nr:translation initiation factor eIF-1A [Nanoarchaeota archaeon]MBU4086138.1 translation initiation factor eIF-1A [Nanoarchaeota archaeon]